LSRVLDLIEQFRGADYHDAPGNTVRDIICKEVESAAVLDVKEYASKEKESAPSTSTNSAMVEIAEEIETFYCCTSSLQEVEVDFLKGICQRLRQ
jgi:hypothetical protein